MIESDFDEGLERQSLPQTACSAGITSESSKEQAVRNEPTTEENLEPKTKRSLADRYPRTCACLGGIVLPLWILVFVSLFGGHYLANFEAPYEYDSNDSILANRRTLEKTTEMLNEAKNDIVQLPAQCLIQYLETNTLVGTNVTYMDYINNSTLLDDGLNLEELLFLTQIPGLIDYMDECGSLANALVTKIIDIRNGSSVEVATQSLTFNWIRCWNETEYGKHSSFRWDAQLKSAAANQSNFYTASWYADQLRLRQQYVEDLGENATESEQIEAWERAIEDATGRQECSGNIPGTAWFFFTVMTTVGYGNQAPISPGGRALVACFGFVTILAFGAVSAVAAQIVIVVFDDLVARWNLRILSRPSVGVVLWATVTMAWTAYAADRFYNWWNERLPEEDLPYADRWDSVWFAYITTSTVGLGDYFLQPAYMSVNDVFRFAMTCLLCFVFFATLLGQFAALLSGLLPDAVDKLRHRVASTNLTDTECVEEASVETELIKILRQLASEDSEVPSTKDTPSLGAIQEEEELLKLVLEKRELQRQRLTEEMVGT